MTGDDPERTVRTDERAFAISDGLAAGTLVVLALVLAAGLGLGVLYAPAEETGNETRATFAFDHYSEASELIVTFSGGDPLPAGEIAVTSGETNVTWATLANTSASKEVSEGATVQLSRGSAFGKPVASNTQVRILWTGGNETRELARWPEPSEDE